MPDAALGHDRDGDGGHDLTNLFGAGHASHAAFGADLRGHALEGHDGDGSGFFGDGGLGRVGDIHNYAAFEHFGEAGLEAKAGVAAVVLGHDVYPVGTFSRSRRIGRPRRQTVCFYLTARGGFAVPHVDSCDRDTESKSPPSIAKNAKEGWGTRL